MEALRPFHERMEECFKQLKKKVQKEYGVRELVRTGEMEKERDSLLEHVSVIQDMFFSARLDTDLLW